MYLIRKYTKRFYHKLIDSLFEKFLNLLLRYPIIKKKKRLSRRRQTFQTIYQCDGVFF